MGGGSSDADDVPRRAEPTHLDVELGCNRRRWSSGPIGDPAVVSDRSEVDGRRFEFALVAAFQPGISSSAGGDCIVDSAVARFEPRFRLSRADRAKDGTIGCRGRRAAVVTRLETIGEHAPRD